MARDTEFYYRRVLDKFFAGAESAPYRAFDAHLRQRMREASRFRLEFIAAMRRGG